MGKVALAVEPRNEFVDDAVARGLVMFQERLITSIDATSKGNLPPGAESCLHDILLGQLFYGFRRSMSRILRRWYNPFKCLIVDADSRSKRGEGCYWSENYRGPLTLRELRSGGDIGVRLVGRNPSGVKDLSQNNGRCGSA